MADLCAKAVSAVALLLALSGCGGSDHDATTTQAARVLGVADAIAKKPADPARVRGFVVYDRNREPRLCSIMLDSYPPQCGGPSLRIDGPELRELGLKTQTYLGTVWTDEPVELIGLVRDGVLLIEEPHR